MPAEKTIDQLRGEIQRLEDEQQKLRQQIREVVPSNGARTAAPPEPPAQKPPDEEKEEQHEPKRPFRERARNYIHTHRKGLVIALILLVILGIAVYFLLQYFNSYESTDDAFIDGHLDPIGTRISGTVTAVYVENEQFVKAGQVLVQLDPRDYQVAVEQARAAYNQAVAQIHAENPNVPITQTTTQTNVSTANVDVTSAEAGVAAAQSDYEARLADLRQAQAQNTKTQADLQRYTMLVQRDEVSRQQFDAARAAAQSDAAGVEAARASANAAQKELDQRRAQLLQARTRLSEAQTNGPRQIAVRQADIATRQAAAQSAKAQLDRAQLELSYTQIVAPVSGVVTSRTADVGSRVQPGEALLSIADIANVWVTANFKETELHRMRPGQSVQIHVDAFNKDYQGYVEGMPGASGQATSLLPPENATGNFVKVVQRLPVRILLKPGQDPDQRLRLGMSCEPKVWL